MDLLVSFESEVRSGRMLRNEADFGFGTLAAGHPLDAGRMAGRLEKFDQIVA